MNPPWQSRSMERKSADREPLFGECEGRVSLSFLSFPLMHVRSYPTKPVLGHADRVIYPVLVTIKKGPILCFSGRRLAIRRDEDFAEASSVPSRPKKRPVEKGCGSGSIEPSHHIGQFIKRRAARSSTSHCMGPSRFGIASRRLRCVQNSVTPPPPATAP